MELKEYPIINTKRLILKSLEDSDQVNLMHILRSDIVSKTYLVPNLKSQEDESKLFQRIKELSYSNKHFVYGIYFEKNLIGLINDVDINNDMIELGYVIHPNYFNKGYATESLKALIKIIFLKGYKKIRTGAFESNFSSIRVMQKCEMKEIDYTDYIEYQGKKHKCIYYEITKD